MKKSQADQTTAKNLEEKFDRGEDVLDYFEVPKARVINPRSKGSFRRTIFSAPVSSTPHPARSSPSSVYRPGTAKLRCSRIFAQNYRSVMTAWSTWATVVPMFTLCCT